MDFETVEDIPFLTHFASISDPRLDRNKCHNLCDILFIAVAAVLCGANHCVAIADFAKARQDWLRQFVPMEGGPPSHDTFSRVLSILDPKEFELCFVNWTNTIHSNTDGEVVPIDGKTVRRSFDKATGQGAIHMVSAWGSANGIVLGQEKVDDKSNEITAIPKLLDMLDIKGRIITVDSLGTQKTIAKKIIEKEGDYVMAVKDNHPNLAADIRAFFERNRANNFMDGNADVILHDYHKTIDADHGRIEIRKCWCSSMLTDVADADQWKGLQSIILVESERTHHGQTSIEQRYYISSLPANAKKSLKVIRTHWAIENSLHWVLDVTFREDEARTRKGSGPQIKSALNRIAINLCKTNRTRNVATSRKRNMASWDQEFLTELITGKTKF
jgi:predicted transposase YbfD/YdcC